MAESLADVVQAINDLTRVTIALHGDFSSKSEAIRRLAELAVPANRIAAILAMQTSDVSSALAKARKSEQRRLGQLTVSHVAPSADESTMDT